LHKKRCVRVAENTDRHRIGVCTCKTTQRQLKANLLAGEAKRTTYEGRQTLIVPVIMARADVVMNDGIIPVEEMVPYAWNGVPVTVGHPQAPDGSSLPANDPAVLTQWSVGRIHAPVVSNGVLKAEARIDIARAERVYPGLVKRLERGDTTDVSTGYFCTPEQATGNVNGKTYSEVHRNLRPEHLALLPDEQGACGWEDGCGVRSNIRGIAMKASDAVAALRSAVEGIAMVLRTNSKQNARGSDDDRRQMRADLIASDDSPFTPDDEDSLRMMSDATLTHMRDAYLKKSNAADPEEDEDEDDKGKKDMAKHNAAELKTMVADAVKEALAPLVKDTVTAVVTEALKANGLSDDDKAALADAKKARETRKADLVARVVANSAITKEVAEKMDFATLETVANGLLPMPSYGGRAAPATNADGDDEDVTAMSEFHGDTAIANALKAKQERRGKAH
jgi:uncharacterized protein DUF2213